MRLWSWLTGWLRIRRTREIDLDREINAHLDLEAEEHRAAGRSPKDASSAARRAFGNVALVKEETREAWGWASLSRLTQDVKYGLRLMRRSPVVTIVAVLSLALGIGANGAIFSVFDALMLRTLPVSHAEQLVSFAIDMGGPSTVPFASLNYALFVQFRDGLRGTSAVAAIADLDRSNVNGGAGAGLDPEPVHVALVSGSYFPMLGIHADTGRALGPDDDRVPGGHPVESMNAARSKKMNADTRRYW